MRHFIPRAERPQPDGLADRRLEILQAALALTAERGLEGLRVREAARRAGVNVATLHYYFPSKHDLIAGLSHHLVRQFMAVHAPAVAATDRPARDWLRQGLADAEFYARSRPDLVITAQELALRAKRDERVRQVMDKLTRDWRRAVSRMVNRGRADGTFRRDLGVAAIVNLLAAVFSGAAHLTPREIADVGASIESLMLAKPRS